MVAGYPRMSVIADIHVDTSRALKIGLVFACFLAPLAPPAKAQKTIETCPNVEVRSVNVSADVAKGSFFDTKPERIETTALDNTGKQVTLVAIGPILGSMDSRNVETELSCTAIGVVLVATVSRSEQYSESVLRNQLWRPQVRMVITLGTAKAIFQATWKMRLTNGKMVDSARTAPYPGKKYPITVTKIMHGRQS